MRRPLLLPLLVVLLSACSTPGAFFGATDGPAFEALAPRDGDHALVYIYRPRSDWADQELEAPGLFLDGRLIGTLPSNGYLALEFDVANYRLEMRRPLMGTYWTVLAGGYFDFTQITSFAFEAGAGGTYYLRYDELNPPPKNAELPPQGDGPLQLVGEALGRQEIAATRQVQPLLRIDANGQPL